MADENVITLDQARKCPECGHEGTIANTRPIQGGSLFNIRCQNEVCPWYDTEWLVETNTDGEVQVNKNAMEKAQSQRHIYKKGDPAFDETHAKIHQMLGRQLDEETDH